MKRYEITPDLRTGNEMIDSEHQRIFDEANALIEACESGHARERLKEMAEFLGDYVGVHFADEEGLQTQYNYPDYPNHKKFHEWYKKDLKGKLEAAEKETNTFNALGKINQAMDVLLKHIQKEDTRLAKWVQEQTKTESVSKPAKTSISRPAFSSSFQAASGKKEIDLKKTMDMGKLQKLQELFTAATGMACAVVDLKGKYITKGSGSTAFFNCYSQGKHGELLEFTQDLIFKGYQAGGIIGGVVKNEQSQACQLDQEKVFAAGQLFAEMVNQWADALYQENTEAGSVAAFTEEAHQVQEAISQIKNRAKGLEQTATMEKMLSLNAAIEAGRAGKAGVGFAVVAEEIGRMANESAAVYREIQDLVRQVEESMDRIKQTEFK